MFEYGIVEDINDPEQLGRARVRVFGLHSHSLADIPTEDLPWASVLQPTTSAANSGVGTSPRLLPGTLVMLTFTDADKQFPIVLGTLPSELKSTFMNVEGEEVARQADGYGFQDPAKQYPKTQMYGENDINRLAKPETYFNHPSYINRTSNRLTGLLTANAPVLSSIAEAKQAFEGYLTTEGTFDEPVIMDGQEPVYPSNQVRESAMGIVEEWDDANTRKHSYHPSGTYEEIIADGSRTLKVVGLGTEIYIEGRNLYITGDWNVTVTGDKRELVQGNYILEVGGDMSIETQGMKQEKVAFDSYQEIGGNQIENIGGNRTTTIAQNEVLTVGKDRATSIGEDEIRSVVATEDVSIGDNASHRYSANLKETISGKSTRLTIGDSTYTTGGMAYMSQTDLTFRTKNAESWTVNTGDKTVSIETGNETTTIAGNQTITATLTDIKNDVSVTGTATASTDVVGGGVSLKTHTHSGVQTGLSNTGVPN